MPIRVTCTTLWRLIALRIVPVVTGATWRCPCGAEKVESCPSSVARAQNTVRVSNCFHVSGVMGHKSEKGIYRNMIKRCIDPDDNGYKYYGARGIRVCKRWLGPDGFTHFFEDMGPRPTEGPDGRMTLERNDVNGNYTPRNCRWATYKEQSRNKRKTLFIRYNGESKTVSEWAEINGVQIGIALGRLRGGHSFKSIFSKKPIPRGWASPTTFRKLKRRYFGRIRNWDLSDDLKSNAPSAKIPP